MTQNQQVLHHMRHFGSITTLTAFKRYEICRLARCIGDLEEEGHLILHTPVVRGDRRYVAYSLVEGKRKAA